VSTWSGRRTRHQTDPNHKPVGQIFRTMCPVAEDHSQGNHGYDWLIKTALGSVYAVEMKDGTKPPSERRLSPNELSAQLRWGTAYVVVLSEDEAIALART